MREKYGREEIETTNIGTNMKTTIEDSRDKDTMTKDRDMIISIIRDTERDLIMIRNKVMSDNLRTTNTLKSITMKSLTIITAIEKEATNTRAETMKDLKEKTLAIKVKDMIKTEEDIIIKIVSNIITARSTIMNNNTSGKGID